MSPNPSQPVYDPADEPVIQVIGKRQVLRGRVVRRDRPLRFICDGVCACDCRASESEGDDS